MARARDTQRSKVYDWEHCPEWNTGVFEWSEVVALVTAACEAYGLSAPTIKDGRRTKVACANSQLVSLPLNGYAVGKEGSKQRGRCMGMILHEAAHNIAFRLYGLGIAGHGPEFTKVFIDLMERFAKADGPALRKAARAARVHVATAVQCPPPLSRRDVKRLAAIKERKAAIKAETEALTNERLAIHRKVMAPSRREQIDRAAERRAALARELRQRTVGGGGIL